MIQANDRAVAESGLAAAISIGTEETDNLAYAVRNARVVYETYVVIQSPQSSPETAQAEVNESGRIEQRDSSVDREE